MPASGVLALALYAASRVLIAAFPVGTERKRITPPIAAHLVLAAITFVSSAVAAWILTGALVAQFPASPIASVLLALKWLVVITTTATFASSALPSTQRFFGLIERGWYGTTIAWLVSVAGLMLLAA